ncbi:Aquaporin-4 [Labeo rohita]|uniref:Aquaporin-4 n=1 Tax=Labeo rohita TaxID=84645 RepID=A0ABQ8LMH9_LABRO|nr:Aquaporin-4 [Labeo rohita]
MAAFKGVWTQEFWRAVSGEFLAMIIFVLISLGSTINWTAKQENPPPVDLVLISLCFGLSIATLVQCFGHISGAHINPAVTAAMVATRKLSLAKGVFYLLAQCLGAVVGSAILYGVTPASVRGGMGVTSVNEEISTGHAIVIELIITFELVFTVFATCDPKRNDLKGSAALAIGLSVCIGHLFADVGKRAGCPLHALMYLGLALIPYTGASMNPARSFGPAVIMAKWQDHWVYWVGPLIGGILAAAVYEYLFCPDPDLKRRYADVLSKGPFQIDPYRVVDMDSYPNEQAQLMAKQATIRVLDLERAEKKEREAAGEVLSSV